MIYKFSNICPFGFRQLNFIALFAFLIKYYHILFIIVFSLDSDKLEGLFLFRASFTFFCIRLFLSSSSVPLSYFSLAVPMRQCLGKHSCRSSFRIAILIGTSFFLSLVQEKLNMTSGDYYRLCSRSGRSNRLIKIRRCPICTSTTVVLYCL